MFSKVPYMPATLNLSLEARARQSLGISDAVIYRMVAKALEDRQINGELLVDVGCGTGNLWSFVRHRFARYIGIDAVRYEEFPREAEFVCVDLDSGKASLPEDSADAVIAVETIEHLENPRAFMRELARLAKAGGILVVTTPNQLSLASKLCLVLKNEFVQFQERPGLYPAHLSALLEIDLVRLARENALTNVEIAYTGVGRIPLTSRRWPRWLPTHGGWRGRLFSDNVLLIARKTR